MLIEDNLLNVKEFKKLVKKFKWVKYVKVTSPEKSETYYSATFKEGVREVKISIRPSGIMQISESEAKYNQMGKEVDLNTYKKEIFSFGTTIRVRLDDTFLKKIDKLAKPFKKDVLQDIKWR